MKNVIAGIVVLGVVGLAAVGITKPHEGHETKTEKAKPKLETLLKTELEGVKGTEVIVSHVTIPPNTSLPKHWHPGEEFAYILEGSIVLWQKDKPEVVMNAGDIGKVPLKAIHTAMTKEQGATLLVFRVHEMGQPERVLVD
jgi:quercetin dioxygenase-like cupin family protein